MCKPEPASGRLLQRRASECIGVLRRMGTMETLCLVETDEKKQLLVVPPSMMGWIGGSRCSTVTWNWLFVISFDAVTGKRVCGYRSKRGWSGWIGTWTMSCCGRVVIVNVGRFSYVLKVKNMVFTSAKIRQMQLCDEGLEDHDWNVIA